MKRLLIPKFNFGGHYLEYVNHIYQYAINSNRVDGIEYIFCLSFEFAKYIREIPGREDIIVYILSDEDMKKLDFTNNSAYIKDYKANRLLKKLILKYSVTDVFHIHLTDIMRFLPIFTVRGVKYAGIFYSVYFYKMKELAGLRKLQEYAIQKFLSINDGVSSIFICNDSSAACAFNKYFHTKKYKKIPDPFVLIKREESFLKFRELHGISNDSIILAHFGSMTARKGTLEILKAILKVNNSIAKNMTFVFAGKIDKNIQDEFHKLVNKCKSKTNIIVRDEFCPFDYLAGLCMNSQYILMPYFNTENSSGMFGYASQFGVPVVANNKNLTRKLVKYYHLGILLDDISSIGLCDFFNSLLKTKVYRVSDKYAKVNNVDTFIQTILNCI